MPIRLVVKEDMIFCNYVETVARELSKFMRHEDYPYELILDNYRKMNDTASNLYDMVISYQNATFDTENGAEDYYGRWHFNGNQIEALSLHISDRERDGKYTLNFDYRLDAFNEQDINRLYEHFANIVADAVANPSKEIKNLEIITGSEKHKLLFEFNNTKAEYPADKTIQQLFEEQVERTPNNIAVVFEEEKLTYRELNNAANQVAKVLRDKGAKPDGIVALMLDRSIEMIIGILGILKAGGAYLPIDSDYPKDRIQFMIEDSCARLLLTQRELAGFSYFGVEYLIMDNIFSTGINTPDLDNASRPKDLTYVIYTSGSTGRPKGVMVEHRNAVNLAFAQIQSFGITSDEKILQLSTYCFDASVEQIFIALFTGATLFLVSKQSLIDIKKLEAYIESQGITHIHTVPSLINMIEPRKTYSLKRVVAGGEDCSASLATKWNDTCQFINEYGPTETTVTSIEYFILKGQRVPNKIPIGKPLPNTTVYILNKDMALCPIGVEGELYIGGEGVARGYFNQPKLTAEKFLESPFNTEERLYKTGDLVKWLPDGNIEFLGRIDQQVKIRGFRIELREIENRIMEYAEIKETIVIEKESHSDSKYLCAYFTSDRKVDISGIKMFLTQVLPNYMVPKYFIQLNELPLMVNGKIDKKALPEPNKEQNMSSKYTTPNTKCEKDLVITLEEMLKLERIGTNDDFFDNLGMDSLEAVRFSLEISRKQKINISVSDIYSNSNVYKLATHIDGDSTSSSVNADGNSILLKNSATNSKNLFLFHDGFNKVESYIELCNLMDIDANCWGIRSSQFEDLKLIELKIEDVAEDYIGRLKQIQPNGPYSIIGWSLGGTIAFDVVRELEAAGERINFFAVFDSVPPESNIYNTLKVELLKGIYTKLSRAKDGKYDDEPQEVKKFADYVSAEYDKLRKLIPYRILEMILAYSKENITEILQTVNPLLSFIIAAQEYVPASRIITELRYYKASETCEFDSKGWDDYCHLPVKYFEVEGDHFSMLKNPLVDGFAKKISLDYLACIDIKL